MYYLYRFLGENGEILYVGKTVHMYDRMCLHFGNHTTHVKQIPEEDSHKVRRVEYTEIERESDVALLEIYMISTIRPPYNKEWVMNDIPSYKLDYGELNWKEWELRRDDNPHHHIFIWKDDVLLYEIPKIHEVYEPLCNELGIEQDMNFGYGQAMYSNGYKLMRLSGKRHIRTGAMAQRPKYSFMGYPEKWAV